MVTVADAGILPDISWYTVCRGSLMGKLLANLKNTDRRISYYIDKSTITEKRGNPIFFFFYFTLSWPVHVSYCPSYWPTTGRGPKVLLSWLLLVHPIKQGLISDFMTYLLNDWNTVKEGFSLPSCGQTAAAPWSVLSLFRRSLGQSWRCQIGGTAVQPPALPQLVPAVHC